MGGQPGHWHNSEGSDKTLQSDADVGGPGQEKASRQVISLS